MANPPERLCLISSLESQENEPVREPNTTEIVSSKSSKQAHTGRGEERISAGVQQTESERSRDHTQQSNHSSSATNSKKPIPQNRDTELPSNRPQKQENDTEQNSRPNLPNTSLLADCSFAADITTQIPRHLRSLTNQELRQRLVSLGEQPGPVTELTRRAYLVYLSKLEAGVQPAGNAGYKGQLCGGR